MIDKFLFWVWRRTAKGAPIKMQLSFRELSPEELAQLDNYDSRRELEQDGH